MVHPMTKNAPIKLDLSNTSLPNERLENLRELFPEAVSEGKIDFTRLKQILGEAVDERKEKYGLSWAGKSESIQVLQVPANGTLVPMPDESVNFDTSENLIIEGDNLEVLKLLQRSYYGKIKMIYIDPPYNTGNEFIYPDNFKEGLEDYLKYSGQTSEEGLKLTTNTEANGRYHSKWLSMMYPRVFLARNLMRDDGYLVVSIDDAEFSNLKALLNEVFGEENQLAVLVWDKNRKNDAKFFSVGHEYMLVYAKNKQLLKEMEVVLRAPKVGIEEVENLFAELRKKFGSDWQKIADGFRAYFSEMEEDDPRKVLARFNKFDEKGPYRDDGNINWPGGGGPTYDVIHPITGKPCKKPRSGWRYPTVERFQEEVTKGRIVFGSDETTVPSVRMNLFESATQVMRSVQFSYAQTASNEFDAIFDGARVFENPKHFADLASLVDYLTGNDDIILDFFAGSCSSAHAVLLSNVKNSSSRKFICVQLPEKIGDKTSTEKAARALKLKTIFDLGAERVRRVIKSMKDQKSSLDLGFKAFKLTSSNFKEWEPEKYGSDEKALAEQLKLHIENVKDDRNALSIAYEILLKLGYELSTPLEAIKLVGEPVYSIAGGEFLLSVEKTIKAETLREMIKRKPKRIVCLDVAFQGNDELKTNIVLEMRSHEIEFHTA